MTRSNSTRRFSLRSSLRPLGVAIAVGLAIPGATRAGEFATCEGASQCSVESTMIKGPGGVWIEASVLWRDGVPIFEGDIVATVPTVLPFSATLPATDPDALWPDGVIRYELDESLFDVGNQIQEAIDHWNDNTVVQLVPSDTAADRVKFVRDTKVCNSKVGRVGGIQKIRLTDGCAAIMGKVAHEIGHAAGLWHEQMRSDRNEYVDVRFENVLVPSDPKLDPTHNFETYLERNEPGEDVNRYDYGSIMQYPRQAFNKPGTETIVPLADSVEIGQRIALSPGDIAGVASLYGALSGQSEDGDNLGEALVACDFDGDLIEDLAIGVPDEALTSGGTTKARAGMVNVLYGTGAGLSEMFEQGWHLDREDLEGSAVAEDRFGAALAAGNFNDDAFCDLAVGVPGRQVSIYPTAGQVRILYGSLDGLGGNGSESLSQGPLLRTTGDRFGEALAAGDFNRDDRDDLAVGVPYENITVSQVVRADAGLVEVIYGSDEGLEEGARKVWRQGADGIVDSPESNDRFGYRLAAADFDGDGDDDLAIGVPYEGLAINGVTKAEAGAVHTIKGSTAGLTSTGSNYWSQESSQGSSPVEDTSEANDHFGLALAAGDFDADGSFDLAVGVPDEDVVASGVNKVDAGAVNLLYGSSGGITTAGDKLWHQDVSGVEGSLGASDRFGFALAARLSKGGLTPDDASDDAYDLVIGVPREGVSTGGVAYPNAGHVNVLRGVNGPLTSNDDQGWHQGMKISKVESEDRFGYALATGDFDGDGSEDLAVGVPNEDVEDEVDAGAVFVLYEEWYPELFGAGLSAEGAQTWHQDR